MTADTKAGTITSLKEFKECLQRAHNCNTKSGERWNEKRQDQTQETRTHKKVTGLLQ